MRRHFEHPLADSNSDPLDWQIKGILGLYMFVAILLAALAVFG